eukprot:TRINITY_DN2418_c0_g1_i3.p1 TRINITY_DN2418_c0_g1~~TRINITY_DN2418_c0_g1_i3.p1  ORF type:complete len:607 (-),score=107.45 TRINITY_DN2418_c0_g1_i3:60-1880(-)
MWPSCSLNNQVYTSQNPDPEAIIITIEIPANPFPVSFQEVAQDRRKANLSLCLSPLLGSEVFENVLAADPLQEVPKIDKKVWRSYCYTKPESLAKLLKSVCWTNPREVDEMHLMLKSWELLEPEFVIELLDSKIHDKDIRTFAVKSLEKHLSDDDLMLYMLQLVQALKFEIFHDSSLVRFLLSRALYNPIVAHHLFWHLKGDNSTYSQERFNFMIEVYKQNSKSGLDFQTWLENEEQLKQKPSSIVVKYTDWLDNQTTLVNRLIQINHQIKLPMEPKIRNEVLLYHLRPLQKELPPLFNLPLLPKVLIKGIVVEKCKWLDSFTIPIWLTFLRADAKPFESEEVNVIFKIGDDLRQDILTLQMFQLMDTIWKKENLDFKMSLYSVVNTGENSGMIEVVSQAFTTAKIHKEFGGAAAALKKEPLLEWLKKYNTTDEQLNAAIQNLIYSCVGYCVGTYVLGVTDRHNDNIMCRVDGKLFHIDFGNFLGNIMRFGLWRREKAPFVLTPDFVHAMGGEKSDNFQLFIDLCCRAFNILRDRANVILSLFALMLSTGLPQLRRMEDVRYVQEALVLKKTREEATRLFKGLVKKSLHTKRTRLNNFVHILVHPD